MLARAARFRFTQRAERVGGLAGLRDGDGQRAVVDDRLAVPELGAVVHLDRHPRQFLDQELPHQPGVPRRAAREDDDALDRRERRGVDLHLFEKHASRLDATSGRAPSPARPRAARGSP